MSRAGASSRHRPATTHRAEPPADEGLLRVLSEDGRADPALRPPLPPDSLRGLYRAMLRVRVLDRRMMSLQRQGRIGFYGGSTGQEGATIGSAFALEPQDWIFPALRESGAALLRGLPLAECIAQLIGTAADPARGRQMPCHPTFREGRYVSMSSCIGTQIPHAVGAAWAARIRRDPVVVLCYLGDGATSEGDFHAGMNFAAVFRCPVVLLCQNNQYSISLPVPGRQPPRRSR